MLTSSFIPFILDILITKLFNLEVQSITFIPPLWILLLLMYTTKHISEQRKQNGNWSCAVCLVGQSCTTLGDLMDCSPPGSSVHGDSPGKNTGVGGHAFLQGSSEPRSPTLQVNSLLSEPPEKPLWILLLTNLYYQTYI